MKDLINKDQLKELIKECIKELEHEERLARISLDPRAPKPPAPPSCAFPESCSNKVCQTWEGINAQKIFKNHSPHSPDGIGDNK